MQTPLIEQIPPSEPSTPPVKINISVLNQIRALISKEYILMTRRKGTFLCTIITVSLIGLLVQGAAFFCFGGILMLASMLGKLAIESNIMDRVLNFRATFKLMGLRDEAYILANLVFQLGFIMCISTFFLSICFCFDTGAFGVFVNFQYFGWFYLTMFLFNYANLMMCNTFSNLIKDAQTSKEMANMFIGISFLFPFAATIKYIIQYYLVARKEGQQATQQEKIMDYISMMFPSTAFCGVYKNNYMKYNYKGFDMNPLYMLLIQSATYTVLYYLSTQFLANQSGVALTLFKSHNKLTSSLDSSINGMDGKLKILKIKGVVKQYGKFKALNDVSCEIKTNQVTCILGHNGAGKTTLINCICGINAPTEGVITLEDQDVYSSPAVLAGKVGYCTAQDVLYELLTVSEFLVFIAMMKCVENPKQEAMRIMKQCELVDYAGQQIKNLSGGTKRRTTIASAVIGSPKILVMDEPSSGVDPENRRALWKLIESLKSPKSVLILTTHHLEEAEYLSKEVIILDQGKIEIIGSPEDIMRNFGIGYRIQLEGLQNDQQLNQIIESVLSIFRAEGKTESSEDIELHTDSKSLQSHGKAKITIPLKYKTKMGDILRTIQSFGISYEIESNSLEEAFIGLGEKKSHASDPAQVQAREQVFESLYSKKYSSNSFRVFLALTYRRVTLFFSSSVQIMMFIYLAVLPGVCIWTFVPKLTEPAIYSTPFVFGILYILMCSFFAHLPFYERKFRMRFLLKMKGSNSIIYYLNLFFIDCLFSALLIVCTWGFLFLIYLDNYDLGTDFNIKTLLNLSLYLMLWKASFITQSYTIQHLLKVTSKSVRVVPYIIASTNALIIIKNLLIGFGGLSQDVNFWSSILVYIFSPMGAFFSLMIQKIIELNRTQSTPAAFNFLSKDEILACTIVLWITPFIYLILATLLDFLETRLKKRAKLFLDQDREALVGQHAVADANTIEVENAKALEERSDLPIQAGKISKIFNSIYSGSFYALRDVSVVLNKSETLGLLGPNGAGKSTLFNILSTYHDCSSGIVKMNGKQIDINSSFFTKSGICAQDDIVWETLSVAHHLRIIRLMKGIPIQVENEWLELLGLSRFRNFSPSQLSSGMKRKLCFLMAVIGNPSYKFLDEVTTGLDPMARKRTREFIGYQQKIYGGSTIFTTHTMKEAELICDRVLILVNGNACVIDTISNLKRIAGGFNLTLFKTSPMSLGVELAKALSPLFPSVPQNGFTIIEENQTKVTYDLYNIDDLPLKFDQLNTLVDQQVIIDFTLKRKSLEDVFLALSRYQSPRRN